MVEFVSYDGRYPNLCAGTLVIKVNGKEYTFPKHSLVSGGAVWFDGDWGDHVESGAWFVEIPEELVEELAPYAKEIEACVNENVPHGCCGGCV